MSMNSSSEVSLDPQTDIRHLVIFWIYLVVFILSILCSCFIFIQFIRKRILKGHIHTHMIFAILICSFLQVSIEHPIFFSYLYNNNHAIIQTDSFCKFWSCLEYCFNGIILMLICYASIERYLVIFHRNFIHRHLISLHYAPMIFFIIYPLIFYISLINFYPCVNQWDGTMITCGGPCYLYEQWLGTLDLILNLVVPLVVCTIFNVLLIYRVVRQKQRMKQKQLWKRNRRLIFQLLSIVILHNIVWFPVIICLLIIFFSPVSLPTLLDITINLFPCGYYMVVMLCPFVSIIGLPELWPRVPNNVIHPSIHTPKIRATVRG